MYVVTSSTNDYSSANFFPTLKEACKEFNIGEGTVNLVAINDIANLSLYMGSEDETDVKGGEVLFTKSEWDEEDTWLCIECGAKMLEDDDEEKWWCEKCNHIESYDVLYDEIEK